MRARIGESGCISGGRRQISLEETYEIIGAAANENDNDCDLFGLPVYKALSLLESEKSAAVQSA